MQALTWDDMPSTYKDDQLEIRLAEVGELTAAFVRAAKGMDAGPSLVGLPGDSCPCPHWGYMIEGAVLLHTADGDKTYGAGDAFYWAPGHVPVVLEDCSYVDFSPTAEFMKVMEHEPPKS
jgi:hypothetical protein